MFQRGDKIEIEGRELEFLEFCEEPDNGLAIIGYHGWRFKVPLVFITEIAQLRKQLEGCEDHTTVPDDVLHAAIGWMQNQQLDAQGCHLLAELCGARDR